MKISEDDLERLCSLSKQQKLVVKLLSSGYSTKETAYKMRLSPKTIEDYRLRIYMKTKLNHDFVGLIKFAIRTGLTTLCLLGVALAQSAPLATPNSSLVLAFYYPTQQVAATTVQMQTTMTNPITWPALTNYVYRYYSATNLQGGQTQWKLEATAINPVAVTNGGVVLIPSPPVPIYGTQTFYTATTSNSWGTSFFSGLAATAPPPTFPQNLFLNSVNP